MKKLGKLTFSKKLSKEEQKQILGGYSTPKNPYPCRCVCETREYEWYWYPGEGYCPPPHRMGVSMQTCSTGYAMCSQYGWMP